VIVSEVLVDNEMSD